MSRRIATGALALSLAAVLGGSVPGAAAGGPFTTRAKIVDDAYRPRRIETGQGTRVRWVNKGSNTHTVTSNTGLFDSGLLAPGESFVRRFRKTGVFKFHCEEHPEMTGKVLSIDV